MNKLSEYESGFISAQVSVKERHHRERKARRQAILDAAASVFAERGLEGATVEMVAREAEVATGTIYLYFCSRDDLYLNLLYEGTMELRRRYIEIKQRSLGPLVELHAMAKAYVGYLNETRGFFMRQIAVSTQNMRKTLKRKAELDIFHRTDALTREVLNLWTATVKRVHGAGLMRGSLGVDQTAAMLWASLSGVFMLADQPLFRDAMGASAESFVDQAVDFQLRTDLADGPRPDWRTKAKESAKNGLNAATRARRGKSKDAPRELAAISSAV
jgi:AcrR family transcriptional regulator